MSRKAAAITRCPWCGEDPLYCQYHDTEWGVPLRDDRALFEFIVLEGAQAGLSWYTILKKRENYRAAFAGFDAAKVARFGEKETARLLANPGIVRNKLKIAAAIGNARAFLKIAEKHGSFANYIWSFVDNRPIVNKWRSFEEIPARSELSDRISKELKAAGCKFVGSTIVYAHMQATGMVNDHLLSCFRHKECQ